MSKYLDTALSGLNEVISAESLTGDYSIDKLKATARGRDIVDKVGAWMSSNALGVDDGEGKWSLSAGISLESFGASHGTQSVLDLVKECGVPAHAQQTCAEQILISMDRNMRGSRGWNEQLAAPGKATNVPMLSLNSMYTTDVVGSIGGTVPSFEAFGTTMDGAVPDMRVAISVAIMSFHTRLLPRIMPTRSTTQPFVTYTKEYFEVYDLHESQTVTRRLLDLFADPGFAVNELQRIVPRIANDNGGAGGDKVLANGILTFGKTANLFELALDSTKVGHGDFNRTDLVAEGVKLDFVRIQITLGAVVELFDIAAPLSANRLTRPTNSADSSIRNADLKFRSILRKGATMTNGTVSTILGDLTDREAIVVNLTIKPEIKLKTSVCDALGSVTLTVRHDVDNALLSQDATGIVTNGVVVAAGYSLDARYNEENMRKSNIASMTHRQSMSFDIPIGRNYSHDYAIGQVNAEQNAEHLNRVIGIGQDRVGFRIGVRTLEDVSDRIRAHGYTPEDRADYVGTNYIAGDMVRPAVFLGTLDFSHLNVIRDADRAGDIKQKAISYLTAVTSRLLQDSYLLQQLGGKGRVVYKATTSIEVLGNIIGMPHIHNHMVKADEQNNIGDGTEYVLVLPNGVQIDFVTSVYDDMRNRIVAWPVIPGDAENVLNFAHNWDFGVMMAHYTPSGQTANHRMFGNIRELPFVTNPHGFIIDIDGMDIVNGIALNGTLRPVVEMTIDGISTVQINGTVVTEAAPEAVPETP